MREKQNVNVKRNRKEKYGAVVASQNRTLATKGSSPDSEWTQFLGQPHFGGALAFSGFHPRPIGE
jgi:hypothetical protein